jgi:hypothetical protein
VYKQLRLYPQSSALATPCQEGSMYYDLGVHGLMACNSALQWQQVGGGGVSYWAANGNDIYNTNTGNVGIGLPNPSANLDISSPGNPSVNIMTRSGVAAIARVNLKGYGNGGGQRIGEVNFYNNNGGTILNAQVRGEATFNCNAYGKLVFATGGLNASSLPAMIDRMTIDENGNVGIGTATPSGQLEVTSANVAFRVTSTGANAIIASSSGGMGTFSFGGLYGVYGKSVTGTGIYGESLSSYAVYGWSSGAVGVFGRGGLGGGVGKYDFLGSGGEHADLNGWSPVSDRNLKENFTSVDDEVILEKISRLPMVQWNYKKDMKKIRHIAPIAQDFYALFHASEDETQISQVDPAGVALVGIKALNKNVIGLNQKIKEQDTLIIDQDKKLMEQAVEIKILKEAVASLKAAIRKP